jgi:hypothetical protein
MMLIGLVLAPLALLATALLREAVVLRAEVERGDAHLGPVVGSLIASGRVRRMAPNGIYLFLEAHCAPCAAVADRLDEIDATLPLTIVMSDDDPRLELGRHGNRLTGAEAAELAAALRVTATPFAVAIRDGFIAEKTRVRGIEDVERLGPTL